MVHLVDYGEDLARHLVVKALLVFELDAKLHVLLFEDFVEFVNFLYSLVEFIGFFLLLVEFLV